jgi:hypothetical protein
MLAALVNRVFWRREILIGERADLDGGQVGHSIDLIGNFGTVDRPEAQSAGAAAVAGGGPFLKGASHLLWASGQRAWAANALPPRFWQ